MMSMSSGDTSSSSGAGSGAGDTDLQSAAVPQPWLALAATSDSAEVTAAAATITATQRRHALTPEQRTLICAHSAANPKMTQHVLAAWAKQTFALRVEPSQSAISSILQRGRASSGGEAAMRVRTKKKRRVKYPKLDDELLKWVLSCDLHEIKISGELVKQRAEALCEKYKIPAAARPSFSNGWLASFNRRHGLKRFKRDPTRKSTYASDSSDGNDGDDDGDDNDGDEYNEDGSSYEGGGDDESDSLAELESEYNELLHREHENDYNDDDPECEYGRSSAGLRREESNDGYGRNAVDGEREFEEALERKREWRRDRIEELAELLAVQRATAESRRAERIAAKRASASSRAAMKKRAKRGATPVWNELTEKELLASKREADLRIEGLRYDNSLKRIRVVEENLLARKRLKDAGVPDEDIDRLMPLPQLSVGPEI